MEEVWNEIVGFFSKERLTTLLIALTVLAVGVLVARIAAGAVGRVVRRTGAPSALLVRRVTFYVLITLAVFSSLQLLGIDLSLLLGAAGILTVAIGFASQTSASNLISGLFLMSERPFVIGDVIDVDQVMGEVVSIDLLSVKLRAFDNRFVRIPNESLLKSRITNLSHYPIRRVDLLLGVAYREDLYRVRAILEEIAGRNPMAFDEPKPLFQVLAYGDSSVDIQFSVWTARENFWILRTDLRMEIKRAFDEQGVEIPFPHRSLYAGSRTEPFPIRIVDPATGVGPDSAAAGEGGGAPSPPPPAEPPRRPRGAGLRPPGGEDDGR